MKIPDKIPGRHKIRDAHICLLWDRDCMTVQQIAEKKKFTERYIYKILSRNHMFIVIDKEWEKKKRIHRLQVAIKKAGYETKKDMFDLDEQLRKEIEGNSPLVKIEERNTAVFANINTDGRPLADIVRELNSRLSSQFTRK